MDRLGHLVVSDDFPWGLRCAECGRRLRDGDCYSERLTSIMACADGGCRSQPVVELVCVPCAV
jgi:hypothetical protein